MARVHPPHVIPNPWHQCHPWSNPPSPQCRGETKTNRQKMKFHHPFLLTGFPRTPPASSPLCPRHSGCAGKRARRLSPTPEGISAHTPEAQRHRNPYSEIQNPNCHNPNPRTNFEFTRTPRGDHYRLTATGHRRYVGLGVPRRAGKRARCLSPDARSNFRAHPAAHRLFPRRAVT
jgi:hypothetical protein